MDKTPFHRLFLAALEMRVCSSVVINLREMHRSHATNKPHNSVSVGDVVLVYMYDENHPQMFWKLSKVEGFC